MQMPRQRLPGLLPAAALVAMVAYAGCDRAADAGAVATVGDWTLTDERLAELLVLAQPFPLDSASVEGLTRHWIGLAALALRAEAGGELTGPEATDAATWLERREAVLELEREDRLGANVVLDRLSAEVAFRVGDHRLFAHILRRVGPETPPEERDLQRSTAERILRDLLAGRSWDEAVQETEDLETRDASGLLGLFERGELPPELERVAFRLQAGQVSSVTEGPDGFHILYRPRFDEVAELYAARLRRRQLAELDAGTGRVLVAQGRIDAARDATRRLTAIARDPWSHFDSDAPLATWDGGSLTASTAARYLAALPEDARSRLAGAGDRARADFTTNLAVRELRLQEAAAKGLQPSAEATAGLAEQHREEVGYWRAALGLGGASARDGLADYLERMVSRREAARALPPLFEAWLLAGVEWELEESAMLRAAATARRMIGATGPVPSEEGPSGTSPPPT